MTTDVNGDYRGVYTYGDERIGVEDLGEIEGKPNNPLYYLYDAIGSMTAITNMNSGIIDSNRFAPYGEPLDPVAKNARHTNSPYGFTGESHDIEGDLVYLRARYYAPEMMRFIQQDSYLGDINNPLTRNLYIYGNDNPLTYVDPSGHMSYLKQTDNLLDGVQGGVKSSVVGSIKGVIQAPSLIFNLGTALISGKITVSDLVVSGLQGMVEDYTYILKNAYVLSPKTTVSDRQVYDIGTRLGNVVTDLVGAVSGAGAVKLTKLFSGIKGGDKIVKALENIKMPGKKTSAAIPANTKTTQKITSTTNSKVTKVNNKPIPKATNKTSTKSSSSQKSNSSANKKPVPKPAPAKPAPSKPATPKKDACFTADTLIYTKEGYKKIKDIQVGDEVYSKNVETGEKGLKKVKRIFVHDKDKLLIIHIGNKKIETTHEHPFWIEGKGWVLAGDIKVGDKVLLYSGEKIKVTKVEEMICSLYGRQFK